MLLKGQAAFAYSAATDSSTIGSKWLASALTSVMPSLAAMVRAVVLMSPVTMWQRRPLRLHLRATVGRGRQQIQGKPLLPVEHASLPTWTQRQRYCPFMLPEWHSLGQGHSPQRGDNRRRLWLQRVCDGQCGGQPQRSA